MDMKALSTKSQDIRLVKIDTQLEVRAAIVPMIYRKLCGAKG
jgi:hypothetical protein